MDVPVEPTIHSPMSFIFKEKFITKFTQFATGYEFPWKLLHIRIEKLIILKQDWPLQLLSLRSLTSVL